MGRNQKNRLLQTSVNKALELANHKPEKCIIFQREKDKADLNPKLILGKMLTKVQLADCEKMNSNDYALYFTLQELPDYQK